MEEEERQTIRWESISSYAKSSSLLSLSMRVFKGRLTPSSQTEQPLEAGGHSCLHAGKGPLDFSQVDNPDGWQAVGSHLHGWLDRSTFTVGKWATSRLFPIQQLPPCKALAICNRIYLSMTQNKSKAVRTLQMWSKGNFLIKNLHSRWFITLADFWYTAGSINNHVSTKQDVNDWMQWFRNNPVLGIPVPC